MNLRPLPILLALAAALPAPAQDLIGSDDFWRSREEVKARTPALDPKRIINESNSFLKEREPEMTAEEYALYERVVTMISTNVDFALRMLEAMTDDREPSSPAFEFILGNVYYAADRIAEAENSYRSAVARYPDFLRAWVNLGILYYTADRFADAIPCLSKAVVLGDRDPATFGLLAYCLEKEGNVVSAEMAYMQALNGDPENSDWKEGLLRIFITGRQYGRAESLVRVLIKERPDESRLWMTHANILLSQGRKIEAAVLLEAAAGIGVAGPDEILLLGDLYAEQGLAAEAVAMYGKSLERAQSRGEDKILHYVRVLTAAGKLQEADDALAALAAKVTPGGRIALLQCRADLHVARRQWPEARAEAEALLKIAPLNGGALVTVGRTYAEERDFSRAMLAYEAAYRIPESTYRASLELAAIELKNRRYEKSIEYLEKALSIQRSDTVEDYLARVRSLVARGGNPG